MTPEIVRELFDYRDGWLYWKANRGPARAGNRAGSLNRQKGYWKVCVARKDHRAHRLIFLWHNGYLPPEVDHINGDTLDNRIENLRAATHSQNLQNSRKARHNTSGVKGVSWSSRDKKWVAQCGLNGISNYLGYFDDINDAAAAVRRFRELYHGEFANHGGTKC